MEKFDVIIVGAGPAGIFSALELIKNKGLKVLIIDSGSPIDKRFCPVLEEESKCTYCRPCSIMCGWGGAGAFSDGKLTLSTKIGGQLDQYLNEKEFEDLIDYTDGIYIKYGGEGKVYGDNEDIAKKISRKASLANLKFVPSKVKHLGTDRNLEILKNIEDELKKHITIKTRCTVKSLLVKNSHVCGIETSSGDKYSAKYVIAAPGRQGAQWLLDQSLLLKLKTLVNPVDLGVRVEVPASVAEPMTKDLYEAKFYFFTQQFDDKIRTFCMCPSGEVVNEHADGVITVNGHSYAGKKTENTNFALLVSKTFTEPFKDPIAYGQYIARLANLLSGGVIVQRLGDLLNGCRTTSERLKKSIINPTLKVAVPGDLSLVLPYRHLVGIIEMLEALNKIAPGIYSNHTLLYGVEVKFYSSKIEVSPKMETAISNLFAAGDGAGITRSLLQASVSGIMAAREILRRCDG